MQRDRCANGLRLLYVLKELLRRTRSVSTALICNILTGNCGTIKAGTISFQTLKLHFYRIELKHDADGLTK
jgi:hypothetical protein